jgi:hypothetical protein
MVNEKAPPDICAGMDFDSSATSGELRKPTRQQIAFVLPQPVTHAMIPDGMEAGIIDQNLQPVPGCRVPVECAANVLFDQGEKAGFLLRCLLCFLLRLEGAGVFHAGFPFNRCGGRQTAAC